MENLSTAPKRDLCAPRRDVDARVADAETRLEQLEEGEDVLAARLLTVEAALRDLQRIVHRLLNPAGEDPDCDRSGSY